jgi:phage-related protein
MVHGVQKKTPKAELNKAIKRMADCLATDPTP